jgi:hypothetical protein
MREPRPFLEDGSQFGVSRTAFRRMRKAEKLELMIGWFHLNFEDPAQSTPYESAEGGYQWIWGGPYEARDELYSKFGDIVSESFIEEAVKEIESDGIVDWAPVHTGDDYDEPEPPEDPISLDIYLDEPSDRYGSLEEQEVRARAREAIDELREALERPRPVGIGHNRPPEEEEEPEEIAELRPAIAELSAELAKPSPTIALIKRWATPLRSALIACAQWGLKKIDGGIDATVKAGMVGGAGWLENGSPLTASTANNHWDILLLARWSGVLTLAGLVAISLAIGHLLGGPAEDDRTALAIACATRHIGIAVLIATSVPGPRTSVLVAFYTLTSAVISIPYLRWRRASASRGKVSWARRGPGFFRKLIAGAQSLSGSQIMRIAGIMSVQLRQPKRGERTVRSVIGIVLGLLVLTAAPVRESAAQAPSTAPSAPPPGAQATVTAVPIFKMEEIDQLMAPIALYPDDLLVQILTAATYPLEIVMAARWVADLCDHYLSRVHPSPHLLSLQIDFPCWRGNS